MFELSSLLAGSIDGAKTFLRRDKCLSLIVIEVKIFSQSR